MIEMKMPRMKRRPIRMFLRKEKQECSKIGIGVSILFLVSMASVARDGEYARQDVKDKRYRAHRSVEWDSRKTITNCDRGNPLF